MEDHEHADDGNRTYHNHADTGASDEPTEIADDRDIDRAEESMLKKEEGDASATLSDAST